MHEKSGTVLIVDDEVFNIELLCELLGDKYDTMVAKNGHQALKRISNGALPDLVLLDIMMPEMDGYEVCETLKKNPATANLPVIFISALSQENDVCKGLKLGAVDYITKPFHPELVKLRVDNHIKLKRMSDQVLALNKNNDS